MGTFYMFFASTQNSSPTKQNGAKIFMKSHVNSYMYSYIFTINFSDFFFISLEIDRLKNILKDNAISKNECLVVFCLHENDMALSSHQKKGDKIFSIHRY